MEHTKLPLTTWHATHCLSGNVQMDDAYLGGERVGGKTGRGSEDKVPFVAVGSTNAKVHPMYLKLHLLSGFTSEAIGKWAKANLTHGTKIISDGLTCFAAVVDAGCMHEPRVVGGLQLCDLPEFKGVNTVLCNIKTTLAEVFCELKYGKYSQRYLAAFAYRFNRRFDLRALVARLIVDLVRTTPFNEMVVRAQTKTAF